MSDRRLILSGLLLLTVAACELIVDFDEEGETDPNRPAPIPQLDGAVPVLVDAQAIADGTVVRPPSDGGRDGGDSAADAGDAGIRQDASFDAAQEDASAADAAVDAGDLDAALDASADASLDDASDLDGSSLDADVAADAAAEAAAADGEADGAADAS